MLVIRLARGGRKKYPVYRIVAADKRRAASGKFVAVLGHYNPHTKELVIKKDELQGFIGNGAQPSNAVLKLMKQDKIDLPAWAEIKTRDRKPKKEVEEPEAQAEEKTAEVATEAAEAKVVEVASEQAEKTAQADTSIDDASGTATEAEKEAAATEVQEEVAQQVIKQAQDKAA